MSAAGRDLLLLERAAPADIRNTLRGLFGGLVDDAVADERRRGCMVVNAATERVPHDPATSRTVRDVLQTIEDAITDALSAAQERGELAANKDPRALAGFLVIFLNGLRVAAKTNPERVALMRNRSIPLTTPVLALGGAAAIGQVVADQALPTPRTSPAPCCPAGTGLPRRPPTP